DPAAVDYSSVLATHVADGPFLSLTLEYKVLPRQPSVFGEGEVVHGRTSQRDSIPPKRDGTGPTVGRENRNIGHADYGKSSTLSCKETLQLGGDLGGADALHNL